MKTIAVLINFSKRAEHAAEYAYCLAQHIQANIMLYNSFILPSAQPLGNQIAWPMERFDEMADESIKALHNLAEKLSAEAPAFNDVFKPLIFCKSEEGGVNANIAGLCSNRDILMLVMASHQKGIASLLLDNNMHQVIENALVPVLVVPADYAYKQVKKIAFATDLSLSDLEVLQLLKGLAKPLNAEILLVHICPDPDARQSKIEVTNFLQEVTNKIDYPRIYYRSVKNNQVENGLDWLAEHAAVDMLVMIHRKRGFMAKFFNASHAETVAAETRIPLLIYQETR